MNHLNSVIVEGNLVRDPELKVLSSGHQVCNFSLATNRFYKLNDQLEKDVSFFNIETWSKLAQSCTDTLKKGRAVRVVGRLKQDRWSDPAGKAQSKIKIVAEHVDFKPVSNKEGTENQAKHNAAIVETEKVAETVF